MIRGNDDEGSTPHPFELAARWRMSPGTLQNLRTQGKGCRYIKLGKRVLYPLEWVERYESKAAKNNTGQNVLD